MVIIFFESIYVVIIGKKKKKIVRRKKDRHLNMGRSYLLLKHIHPLTNAPKYEGNSLQFPSWPIWI